MVPEQRRSAMRKSVEKRGTTTGNNSRNPSLDKSKRPHSAQKFKYVTPTKSKNKGDPKVSVCPSTEDTSKRIDSIKTMLVGPQAKLDFDEHFTEADIIKPENPEVKYVTSIENPAQLLQNATKLEIKNHRYVLPEPQNDEQDPASPISKKDQAITENDLECSTL